MILFMWQRYGMALLLSSLGCTSESVEAMSGNASDGATEGNATTSTTSAGTSTTSSGDTRGDSGSRTTTTSSTTNETSQTTTSDEETSSESTESDASTGEVRIGCEDLDLPENDPMHCSVEFSSEASIHVVNACDRESIQLFWIDYECGEIPYGIIEPGAQMMLSSFETHPWRLRAVSDARLLAEIAPLTEDTVVELP
jgi:hypothetical protein